MMSVVSTNVTKKTYGLYGLLRGFAVDANIDTLKQISIYVAGSTDDNFDINNDCECKIVDYKEDSKHYLLTINDGRKIVFSSNPLHFGFMIFNYDLNNYIVMSSYVSERVSGDLSTLSVYSEILASDFGKYVITFRPNDMSDETLKFGTINYYTNDEIDWIHEISEMENIQFNFDIVAKQNGIYPFAEKIYFDLPLELKDVELDCFDGCLKNYLNRVDLLYNNVKVYMDNKGKEKEKKL